MKKLRDYHIIDRARDFLSCWKHFAPGADLSGWKMATLEEQLDTATKAREKVCAAEIRLSALRAERRDAEPGIIIGSHWFRTSLSQRFHRPV